MRSIPDTIERLAALRTGRVAAHQPVGAAGRLSPFGDFAANPGALEALTYLPAGLAEGAPLVVVLHGCTQTAAGYDAGSGWSALADRCGFALLFPQQSRANNPNLCFNWFQPGDARRDRGEALSIRMMISAFADRHALDPRRTFVTGLSAGGAMASVMLAAYPEVFAGGAIIAGLPFGSAGTVPEAFDRMRGHGGPTDKELQALLRGASGHKGPWPRLSVWHGDADRTVAPANMDGIVAQWSAVHGVAGTEPERQVVDGHVRTVWRDAASREVIESYSIAGMGHGTPLRTRGNNAYGASGAFMLEAGISSTLRIAEFWGIAGALVPDRRDAMPPEAPNPSAPVQRQADPSANPARPPAAAAQPAPTARPSKIQSVIEEALRSAGLMQRE